MGMRPPSEGICYGCRHPELTGHCDGTGHLEPSPESRWPGFICTCWCVSLIRLDEAIERVTPA